MNVPFVDLQAEYNSIQSEIDDALRNSIQRFNFVRGPEVSSFEKQFSDLLGIKHCIGVGNGTDALFLCLKSLGIKSGDEVITPAFSWISSAETITMCGATPVFCDVDDATFTVTALALQKKITSRTRAIVVVHLYGQAAPVCEIKKLCEQRGLFLIEDCAQAHLSKDADHFAGTIGDAAAFSFYPTKNLGAYGDAGCVVTANDMLAERIRRLANHGALFKDDHTLEGINSRMDSIQAAILTVKLKHLAEWNSRRNKNAEEYRQALTVISDLSLPFVRPGSYHTFHLFVVRTKTRDQLKAFLEMSGVQTIIHYPQSLPELESYRYLNASIGDFPTSHQLSKEVLSLPVHPGLSKEQITYVIEKIKEFYRM